jgi:1-acyl-sn-glycerol-3-phosphate acyltransferase
MLRTIVWFIYFWIALIGYTPGLLKARKMENPTKRADAYARKWSRNLLKMAGAQITVVGVENIPKDSAVVYVGNHQSNFDIPLMISCVPGTKGFIAKKEILKMPLVRDWMQLMQCVFIDRSNIRQQVKAISEGVQTLKNGQSIVVFPEGTRSPDGRLGEFKPGSLKLATKSGAPIVPVAIINSRGLMPKGRMIITPAEVKIVIMKPIEITPEMNKETGALADQIKTMIEREMHEHEDFNS